MHNNRNKTRFIVNSSLIAAAYVILTYLSAVLNLAYGSIQFRISEALTVLSLITPAAIPGLTIGCLIGNLFSPYGIIDIIFGTTATLLASLISYILSRKFAKGVNVIAASVPAIVNALIIGAEITFFVPQSSYLAVFLLSAFEVGIGEFLVCLLLGIPLYKLIKRYNFDKYLV